MSIYNYRPITPILRLKVYNCKKKKNNIIVFFYSFLLTFFLLLLLPKFFGSVSAIGSGI